MPVHRQPIVRLSLDPQTERELEALAAHYRLSRSALVRLLVAERARELHLEVRPADAAP